MPSVIHSRVTAAICRIAALTCVAVFAGAGVASASCPAQPVSNPFSQWGDSNDYFLVPGGTFEGTADQVGWTLSGASLTASNEPFNVNDSGGSATSPYFCVDNTMSALRFFAQEVSGGSDLNVDALVQMPDGNTRTVALADIADGSITSWAPTDQITHDTSALRDGTVMVALQFTVPASSGTWQLDDVYIDPWRSG